MSALRNLFKINLQKVCTIRETSFRNSVLQTIALYYEDLFTTKESNSPIDKSQTLQFLLQILTTDDSAAPHKKHVIWINFDSKLQYVSIGGHIVVFYIGFFAMQQHIRRPLWSNLLIKADKCFFFLQTFRFLSQSSGSTWSTCSSCSSHDP